MLALVSVLSSGGDGGEEGGPLEGDIVVWVRLLMLRGRGGGRKGRHSAKKFGFSLVARLRFLTA